MEVAESQLDAVTGLSGSGPAYVYMFIESMIDAGLSNGLPRSIAHQLAVETVIGSASMVEATELHPAELRDQVASPGGTTIQGIEQLENLGFRGCVLAAVKAATLHSKKLSEG